MHRHSILTFTSCTLPYLGEEEDSPEFDDDDDEADDDYLDDDHDEFHEDEEGGEDEEAEEEEIASDLSFQAFEDFPGDIGESVISSLDQSPLPEAF